MSQLIDVHHWREQLCKPDWYFFTTGELERLDKLELNEQDKQSLKDTIYSLIEDGMRAGTIPLAQEGPNLDEERQTINTIVIHHSSTKPDVTLERLNAMQLLRIYGRYFADPTDPKEKHLKGTPVWSSHFYQNQPVFWGYHWLVRNNGTTQRILKDEHIGWHAANWDINTKSIGICFVANLTETEPTQKALQVAASIITEHYRQVEKQHIIGHHDAASKTECPGKPFYQSWRQKLIDLV